MLSLLRILETIEQIYHTAINASIEASAAILKIYDSAIEFDLKKDGSPVTKADLLSSQIIFNHLKDTMIPLMGEERVKQDYATRQKWNSHWCVDPLDGTKMFLQKNDEFAINIAHVKNGEAIFGLIADPVKSKIILGIKNKGVYIFNYTDADAEENWQKIKAPTQRNNPIIVACSRGFGTKSNGAKVFGYEEKIKEDFGEFNLLKKGSALKFFDLAEGKADMYVRLGPTMEWDIAAGQIILEELGGTIVSLENGERLTYNKESLFNPPFIAKTKVVK